MRIELGQEFEGGPPWREQRPYPNGVVVYAHSVGTGGGEVRGQATSRIATRNGIVVGVYENDPSRQRAEVAARFEQTVVAREIRADVVRYGNDQRYVERTTFSKWIAAVKAMRA